MRGGRWETRAAAGITLAIIALRAWIARKITFCGTPDSCYALGLAQTLAQRHAFKAPFIFDLQLRNLHLPNSGLEYWRPGVSLVFFLLHPLGAISLHESLVVTALMGVVWALAAWHIALRATGNRAVALASYCLCLLLPPGWESSLTPDPTLFYAAAVAWFLALFTVERQGLLQDVIALVCLSAAYMIRNDAGLLAAPFVVVLWLRWRGRKGPWEGTEGRGTSTGYIAAMILGFVLALVPMHLVYRHVMGTAFPPGASRALFLNDLSDFSNYGVPVSAHTMLSHGVKHLIMVRVGAGAMIVYRVLALVLGYTAVIFLPTLWVRTRRERSDKPASMYATMLPEFTGAVVFAVVLLLVYALVLPAVGVFSALRSSTALLPLASVCVVVAILRLAKTRSVAKMLTGAVIAAYFVSGIMDDRRAVGPMNAMGDADRAQAEALESLGARPDDFNTVVMTPDPVQFSVTTGFSTVPLAGNGLDAITNEALALHATHAILDSEHLPGSPDAVAQKLHPMRTATVPGQQVLLLELPPEFSQR